MTDWYQLTNDEVARLKEDAVTKLEALLADVPAAPPEDTPVKVLRQAVAVESPEYVAGWKFADRVPAKGSRRPVGSVRCLAARTR